MGNKEDHYVSGSLRGRLKMLSAHPDSDGIKKHIMKNRSTLKLIYISNYECLLFDVGLQIKHIMKHLTSCGSQVT